MIFFAFLFFIIMVIIAIGICSDARFVNKLDKERKEKLANRPVEDSRTRFRRTLNYERFMWAIEKYVLKEGSFTKTLIQTDGGTLYSDTCLGKVDANESLVYVGDYKLRCSAEEEKEMMEVLCEDLQANKEFARRGIRVSVVPVRRCVMWNYGLYIERPVSAFRYM